MRSVLITGAAGFIGSHVVEVFHEAGWKIRATDRAGCDFAPIAKLGVEVKPADLRYPDQIPPLLEGVDTVVHLAAFFDFALRRRVLYDANVVTTENLCAAAAKAGISSFVQLSTVGVYGNPKVNPCPEDAPKNPQNAYEETKWLSEQVAMRYWREKGLPVRALRPTLVYGPRNRGGFSLIFGLMSLMAYRRRRGIPVLTRKPISHFVHVEDVARGCLHLAGLRGVDGQAFNVADDHPHPMGEIFAGFQRSLGLNGKVVMAPDPIIRISAYGAMALPRILLAKINENFAGVWKKVQVRHGLYPHFTPRLDRDWFEYMLADHVYTTEKLRATGFRVKYPDVLRETDAMVRWYRANRWIPPTRAELAAASR